MTGGGAQSKSVHSAMFHSLWDCLSFPISQDKFDIVHHPYVVLVLVIFTLSMKCQQPHDIRILVSISSRL